MSPGPPTPRARAPRVPPPPVTPEGLRDGDPFVLAALVGRYGAGVLGYASAVAPAGEALRTAAAAFVELRVALLTTRDAAFDPAVEVLAATRRVAARLAENPYRPGEHARPAERTAVCERLPRLLAAWAAGGLPDEDVARLREHVAGCPDCEALHAAFDRAETVFRAGPAPEPTPEQAGGLIAAAALASSG